MNQQDDQHVDQQIDQKILGWIIEEFKGMKPRAMADFLRKLKFSPNDELGVIASAIANWGIPPSGSNCQEVLLALQENFAPELATITD